VYLQKWLTQIPKTRPSIAWISGFGGQPRGKPAKGAEVCRKLGVSAQTVFRWKAAYRRLGVSELRELGQVQVENNRLKRLVANPCLDKPTHQEVLSKLVSQAQYGVRWCPLTTCLGGSDRHAWGLMGFCRPSLHFKYRQDPEPPLRRRIKKLAATRVRSGFRRRAVLLRWEDWVVNTKRA